MSHEITAKWDLAPVCPICGSRYSFGVMPTFMGRPQLMCFPARHISLASDWKSPTKEAP